jgi:hypothetical protein
VPGLKVNERSPVAVPGEPEPPTPVVVRPAAVRRPREQQGWASEPTTVLEWRMTQPGRIVDPNLMWGSWFTAQSPIASYVVQ